MRLLLLIDRKPGHFRQVEGLAQIIARHIETEVVRFAPEPSWRSGEDIRKVLLNFLPGHPRALLRFMYNMDADMLPPFDAVISSGRDPMAAGSLVAEIRNVPYIQIGATVGYRDNRFALRLLTSPRLANLHRVAIVPVPTTIDPERYPPPRPLAPGLRGATLSLLIGGGAHGHTYEQADWDAMLAFIEAMKREAGVVWQVSTSRRTPVAVSEQLAAAAEAGIIARFIDYRGAGAGSADVLFGADAMVVTEDSNSMINEALAAKRQVVALMPARSAVSPDTETTAGYAARGLLAVVPLRGLTPEKFEKALRTVHAENRDPRDEIFAAVAPVLGQVRPVIVPAAVARAASVDRRVAAGKPLRVMLLLEKKPGHINRVEGMATALARMAPLELVRVPVRPRWFAHETVRRRYVREEWRDGLRVLYGIDPAPMGKVDLILGSGRPTIAAGLLLAKATGAKFIYSGGVSGYGARPDVMLSPSPRDAWREGFAYAPLPSRVDPDILPPPRPLRTADDLRGASIALLAGGNASSFRFTRAEWRSVVAMIRNSAALHGVRWSVATSRRTPAYFADAVADLKRMGVVETFVDYRAAGMGSIAPLYAADAIVVTMDLLSMRAEAKAARRPVVALAPRRTPGSSDTLAAFAAVGVALVGIRSGLAETLAAVLPGLEPDMTDGRDTIAAVILATLPDAVEPGQGSPAP